MKIFRKSKIKIGDTYNYLTVIKELDKRKDNKKVFLCRCKCGKEEVEVVSVRLTSGKTKSCGCWKKDHPANLKHGNYQNNEVEYACWRNLIDRCTKPNLKAYPEYGGRGIKVCDRWLESFENFLQDVGKRPERGFSLDRINNNGNYEPSNCRWTTKSVQDHNKRPVGNKTNSRKGVYYSVRDDLWTARITVNNKRIILGYFTNEKDATECRLEGELKYLPEVYLRMRRS